MATTMAGYPRPRAESALALCIIALLVSCTRVHTSPRSDEWTGTYNHDHMYAKAEHFRRGLEDATFGPDLAEMFAELTAFSAMPSLDLRRDGSFELQTFGSYIVGYGLASHTYAVGQWYRCGSCDAVLAISDGTFLHLRRDRQGGFVWRDEDGFPWRAQKGFPHPDPTPP